MRWFLAPLLLIFAFNSLALAQAPAPPTKAPVTKEVPRKAPGRAPAAAQVPPTLPFDAGPAKTAVPATPPANNELPPESAAAVNGPQVVRDVPTSTALSAADQARMALPLDSGLPVVVRAGLAFVAIERIDENRQSFAATVDLRLSWLDLRLRYLAAEAPIGYREWRGEAATAYLATIWSPDIGLANLLGEPTRQSWSVRHYPDGRVELLRRVTGSFSSPLDVQHFPFDRQRLQVELVSQDETADNVALDYRQDELLFSRAYPGVEIGGWTVGAVSLVRDPLAGWYGESYARLRVALEVDRRAIETVPALFVPLLASLLIPLLAIWLNRSNNGEFEVKAFELTNIVIGGLFAVIALNFTINSDRSILASSANTVSLLFGLNYLALAAALMINICLFRFNVVRALAGRHVQHETALFITWALPIAIVATAVALILIAAA